MSKIRDIIHSMTRPKNTTNLVGAPSFRYKNPALYNFYEEDNYSSIYPSIKAISNEFMKIRPYAVDSNGKPLKARPPQAINALYNPNQLDSSVSFREKLAVMNLTQRKTFILVWRLEGREARPGGELTARNIAGFTFLENPGITNRDNRTYYNIGSQKFSDKEVITIDGGVDPSGLYRGYAPGIASERWATLDEYIASFQKGFFENGAVPAGQFVITAASKQDFDDTVDKLQEAHRGNGKNNNVTYTPRPVDPNSGKPAEAKIEWIPYQQSNKDIDFKNLFEQANKRIDSTFGVPASIRGVGENNNYATARMDQQNFIRFTIEPIALRIFTQLTHELNRITGGLGYAITFDLDYPAVAEEENVQAETKVKEVTALNSLVSQGYSLDSVIDALQLSNSYKLLKADTTKTTQIDNDKPDVDEGGETDNSPNPDEIDGVTPLNRKPNPKAELSYYDQLYNVARGTMKRQIDRVVSNLTEDDLKNEVQPEPTENEEDMFMEEMMEVIAKIIVAYGLIQFALGKELLEEANIPFDNVTEFTFTDTAQARYEGYLRRVGSGYMQDNAEKVRKVLAEAKANELPVVDTKKKLRSILDTDEYRIKRLAETELNRSQAMGSIESMVEIQNQTGATLEKSLLHTGSDEPCEFCAVLLDRWKPVDQDFVLEGEAVEGRDGGIFINDWQANYGYDPHSNGHCQPHYRVVK